MQTKTLINYFTRSWKLGIAIISPITLIILLIVQLVSALEPHSNNVSPAANTHTAPHTTTVSIEYDQAMDISTVSTQTFAVHAMQTGIITETYSVNGGIISISPDNPFKPGEFVQVSATTATLDITGTAPLTPTVWQFRTRVASHSGEFVDSSQSLSNAKSSSSILGDLDDDGDLDVFVGNNGANTVWLNDGSGTFTDTGQTLGNANSAVALGDLDGDGDLDAFDADFNTSDKVWLNDGSGTFSDSGQNLSSDDNTNLALGDLDGDGDLDVFLINYNGPNSVWFNDGAGIFTNSGQSLADTGQGVGITLADTDSDGDLDAIVGVRSGANQLWLNDGAGSFTDSGQNLGSTHSWGVTTGDVNGDGHVDIFFGNEFGANEVWFNDGSGSFTNSGQSIGSSGSFYGVQLGDLNGDDHLDVLIGTSNGKANEAWV